MARAMKRRETNMINNKSLPRINLSSFPSLSMEIYCSSLENKAVNVFLKTGPIPF